MRRVLVFPGRRYDDVVKDALSRRLVLEPKNDKDTVHGHARGQFKRAGIPFRTDFLSDGTVVQHDICELCGATIPREQEHACTEVTLYDKDDAEGDGVKFAKHPDADDPGELAKTTGQVVR